MSTCLGKSCAFGLPRVSFVNCCQFMYLVISLLEMRAGYGIWLYQFARFISVREMSGIFFFFFQGQGIVTEFYDLSGKMKFCQNVRDMSGKFTFQSCKKLTCLVLMYLSCTIYKFFCPDIVKEIGIHVRELSGNFVLSYVWEPCPDHCLSFYLNCHTLLGSLILTSLLTKFRCVWCGSCQETE